MNDHRHFKNLNDFYNFYYEAKSDTESFFFTAIFHYHGKYYCLKEDYKNPKKTFPNMNNEGADCLTRDCYRLKPRKRKLERFDELRGQFDYKFKLIKKYRTIEDALENWILDGTKFRDVLLSDDFKIIIWDF